MLATLTLPRGGAEFVTQFHRVGPNGGLGGEGVVVGILRSGHRAYVDEAVAVGAVCKDMPDARGFGQAALQYDHASSKGDFHASREGEEVGRGAHGGRM